MIAEKIIIDTIEAATGVMTYFGAQPQDDDGSPSPMPVNIVNRPSTRWPNAFCGTDINLSLGQYQIDYYAEAMEDCRRHADIGRAAVAALVPPPTLDSEVSFYDEESRGWRVMQLWDMTDYQPAVV